MRDVGADAARRALAISGDVAVGGPIVVLELVPEANIAAGEALHGLADLLPDAAVVRLREAPSDVAALIAEHASRRLVLVVRDAARHPWQQAAMAAVATLRPDSIVVETGIPGRFQDGVASIVTHGAGRANLAAAAEALA
jgi:beta-N-acetylhexosaminidase